MYGSRSPGDPDKRNFLLFPVYGEESDGSCCYPVYPSHIYCHLGSIHRSCCSYRSGLPIAAHILRKRSVHYLSLIHI